MKLVRCEVDYYQSPRLRRGTVHTVLDEEPNCYILENRSSSHWDSNLGAYVSRFKKCNFSVVGEEFTSEWIARRHPTLHLQEKVMLHIAVEVGLVSIDNIAEAINGGHLNTGKSIIANTSADALKERIRSDIQKNPEHRWLIFSANTIGEISTPPIRFRSV